MTFCHEKNCAHFGNRIENCHRSLTEKVSFAAFDWWQKSGGKGGGPSIAVYSIRPECFTKKPPYVPPNATC